MITRLHKSKYDYPPSQASGHHIAKLDPLGIASADLDDTIPDILTLGHYNFSKFAALSLNFISPFPFYCMVFIPMHGLRCKH